MIVSLLVGLLPVIVIAAIIAGVVRISRDDDDVDADPGIGTVRRLVLYGLSFVAALIGPTGIGLLIGGLLEAITGGIVIAESDTELATGLSLTLVGSVAWLLLWRLAQSTIRRHPVEQRSLARHLYFGAVRGTAAVAMLVAGIEVLRWLLRLDRFDGNAPAFLLVAGAVWYVHDQIQSREAALSAGTRSMGRLYRFAAAFLGLSVLAVGLHSLLDAVLADAYDTWFGTTLDSGEFSVLSRDLREAATLVIAGAVTWAFHWWRARTDHASTIWRVYVFLGGLLSGITTAIVAASVMLYLTLQWFLGAPRSATAALHFVSMPEATAGLIVGLLLWGYHRAVLAEHTRELAASPSETERVYRYLAAAAGLVTAISGLARVLATTVDLLAGDEGQFTASPGWWQNQLVTGATLLIVGVPLWLRYWRHVEIHAAAGGEVERGALSRRVFLYAVFGASGIAALISLSAILFELFQGLLGGDLSARTLHDTRWYIAVLVSAAGAAFYYWQVLRADQRAAPEAPPSAPVRVRDVVLLGGRDVEAAARRIEQRLHTRVRWWQRTDLATAPPAAALDEAALEALVAQLEASTADRVLVLLAADGTASVIPYTTG
ncbi:MAG: hypothetical protein IT299_12685 [Dehalococcoidia bacterium]|nr:hypothetical protein [Dehalococcoidia bacterium]